jgi:hypothetical protein
MHNPHQERMEFYESIRQLEAKSNAKRLQNEVMKPFKASSARS